jgi:hypothetical protein
VRRVLLHGELRGRLANGSCVIKTNPCSQIIAQDPGGLVAQAVLRRSPKRKIAKLRLRCSV